MTRNKIEQVIETMALSNSTKLNLQNLELKYKIKLKNLDFINELPLRLKLWTDVDISQNLLKEI
jgi:hypothetical protein